jgi:flagellar hook-associated protein 2
MSTSSVNSLSSLTDALASSNSSSTSSSSSSTTGTGLGQGIDVQQFVQYAVSSQEATITSLQSQQSTLASQTSEISTISSDLTALDNAANALSDPVGAMGAETATSSDSSILSATADSSASSGAHTISISNLATTSSYYTDAVASSSTALATGDTVAISVGGTSVASITVNANDDTLTGIAAAINSATTAVQASVINDANGARLALVSTTSGLPGNISVTGTLHLGGSSDTAINFNQAVAGKNASLTVDGVPISSTTNTVSSVIPGVTLNLSAPTVTDGTDNPVSLTVAPDTTQATNAINTFVSAYNTVITEINNQFNVASDGSGGGVLEADGTLRQVQSMLLSAAAYSVSGNSGMVNLASIGVNMNDDGTLTVDNSALSSALSSNFSAVQNLLQNTTTGFAQNLDTVVQSINMPTTGILSVDAQSIANTSTDIESQITDLQAALTVQEQNLTTVYSNVNATLQELPMLENQLNQQIASIA